MVYLKIPQEMKEMVSMMMSCWEQKETEHRSSPLLHKRTTWDPSKFLMLTSCPRLIKSDALG